MDDFLAWWVAAVPQINALALATASGSFSDGTVANPGFTFVLDTNTGIYRPAADTIGVTTGGTEVARFLPAGGFVIGSANAVSVSIGSRLGLQGSTVAGSTIAAMTANAVSTAAPRLILGKSRGAAVDDYTIVAAADLIGNFLFAGADGSSLVNAAGIQGYVIGTPAAGDVRGGLRFQTGSGSGGALTARLSIDDTTIGATLPITIPNGLASAPSLAFFNSTTTGIYRAGADIIGFATAGVEAMRLNASNQLLVSGAFGLMTGVGVGGTVNQATSRTTAITMNKVRTEATLFSAAGSATPFSFTVNNSLFAATDDIIVGFKGGTNQYIGIVTSKAAGSYVVTCWAVSGTATDTPTITLTLVKGTLN